MQWTVAHLAHGTVAGHDTLSKVSQASVAGVLRVHTFKDWVAGAAIVN